MSKINGGPKRQGDSIINFNVFFIFINVVSDFYQHANSPNYMLINIKVKPANNPD